MITDQRIADAEQRLRFAEEATSRAQENAERAGGEVLLVLLIRALEEHLAIAKVCWEARYECNDEVGNDEYADLSFEFREETDATEELTERLDEDLYPIRSPAYCRVALGDEGAYSTLEDLRRALLTLDTTALP